MVTTQKLLTNWNLQIVGESEKFPACVPGSVYSDLLRNGRMEDPFWRDNELQALTCCSRRRFFFRIRPGRICMIYRRRINLNPPI